MLEHEDPAVREVSAHMLSIILKDAKAADEILLHLEVEQSESVVYAFARSVLTLDPSGGRERIAAVRRDPLVNAAVERAATDIARVASLRDRSR
jgi:hypothetical protein